MFCKPFYGQSMVFQVLCSKTWSAKEFVKQMQKYCFMTVQVTRHWYHLHESSLMNCVGTSLGKRIKYFN